MSAHHLSPSAWSREAERQRIMEKRADWRGDQVYAKRHGQLARVYEARAREALG